MTDDSRRRVAIQLREAALETLSTLQDIGPAWSGEFSESWVVDPQGRSTPSPSGVPTLIPAKKGADLRRCGYTIENKAPHAPEAMDLAAGGWETQEFEPVKPRLNSLPARRVGAGRTDVISVSEDDEKATMTAGFTAEPDWYRTYAQGGAFADDVQRGLRIGARQAKATIANR